MSTSRRFLLASSLARLIQTERGGQRIVEGYFPERDGRCSCVRLDGRTGSLILIMHGSNGPAEEPAEIPLAHAEVLLAVTTGEADYVHTSLSLGADAHVSRFTVPGPLDLIDVTFEHEQEAREFQPPVWFGPEVGADPRFRNQSLALTAGIPQDRILAAYPTIKEHHLDLAVAYAEANSLPRQNRHRLPPWPRATLVRSGRILRRKG